jgi:hypothetical protein
MKEKTVFVLYRNGHNPEYFIRASDIGKATIKTREIFGPGVSFLIREPTRAERVSLNLDRVKIEEAD